MLSIWFNASQFDTAYSISVLAAECGHPSVSFVSFLVVLVRL